MFYLERVPSTPKLDHGVEVSPQSAPFGWYSDKPLAEPMPLVTIKVTGIEQLPDFWGIGPYLCASQRLLVLLSSLGEMHFDSYPLVLVDKRGKHDDTSVRIFRFRDRVACMDMEKSECHTDEDNRVEEIRRLFLLNHLIPSDRHFFELAERSTVYIASEVFVAGWHERALRGREFFPVSELDYWI